MSELNRIFHNTRIVALNAFLEAGAYERYQSVSNFKDVVEIVAEDAKAHITFIDSVGVKAQVEDYVNQFLSNFSELNPEGSVSLIETRLLLVEQRLESIQESLRGIKQKELVYSDDGLRWIIYKTFAGIIFLLAAIVAIIAGISTLSIRFKRTKLK